MTKKHLVVEDNSAKPVTPTYSSRNHSLPITAVLLMWSSTYSTRRSHEQTNGETKRSRSSSPGETFEHRRTSSELATPRPTPANLRFLSSADQDASKGFLPTTTAADVVTSSSKRLGVLADKLSSSLSGTTTSHRNQSSQLQPPNNHTRGESGSTLTSLNLANMASSASINTSKTHISPSKASYGRTYDYKAVTREMHRLGNFSQLSGAIAPQLSTAPSTSSLSLPQPGNVSQISLATTAAADPWDTLHVHVLPLFNGEPLKIPIEDLNELVRRHIQTVVSSSPSRALVKLEGDASELIATGMLTLNSKLMDVDDDKLLARIVETWGFFWDQILPYLEGALLPLQTEPLLSSLSRTPKPLHRGTSPSRSGTTPVSQLTTGTPTIDVRTLALRSFRDKVVYPLYPRLYSRLTAPTRHDVFEEKAGYQQPRLQQMLLVLSAQSRRRPATLSLTAPPPQPTPGEAAITDLLLLVRSPHPLSINRTQAFTLNHTAHSRTPSFLSGGKPRDRRGRIGKKHGALDPSQLRFDEDDFGDDTPRMGMSFAGSYMHESDREKDREFLESLRRSSPEPDSSLLNRASIGGWGLGDFRNDELRTTIEEDEDEPFDMADQAQADLEKYMATMNGPTEAVKRRPQ